MRSLSFVVPGPPVPWTRARVNRAGKRFTPKTQVGYRDAIRCHALAAGARPCAGPVAVEVLAVWPTKRGKPGGCRKATRPDIDNAPVKIVLDALTGVAWVDDGQVTDLFAFKRHAGVDEESRIEVTVTPLEE